MTKYHFTEHKIRSGDYRTAEAMADAVKNQPRRVEVDFLSKGKNFNYARLYEDGGRKLDLVNCEGSLIMVDRKKGPFTFDKLHLADLAYQTPHLESSMGPTENKDSWPRIDLREFDYKLGLQRLSFLEGLRDPRVKEGEIMRRVNGVHASYALPHHLRWFGMSRDKLEDMIGRQKRMLDNLNKDSALSEMTDELVLSAMNIIDELRARKDQYEIEHKDPRFHTSKERRKPKVANVRTAIEMMDKLHAEVNRTITWMKRHHRWDNVVDDAGSYWMREDQHAEQLENDSYFVKYDAATIQHIARHLAEEDTPGSVFTRYRGPVEIVDEAFEILRRNEFKGNGGTQVFSEVLPSVVGLNSVVALSDVPASAKVDQELRDGKHTVNVVRGMGKPSTSVMTVVTKPTMQKIVLDDDSTREEHAKILGKPAYGFDTIYPGPSCPGIEEDPEFWKAHAFIK